MKAEWIDIDNRKVLTAITEEGRTYAMSSMYRDDYPKRWAMQNLSNCRHALYLVYGIGDARFINALLEEAEEDALILVVEPSQAIWETSESLLRKDARLRICLQKDTEWEDRCRKLLDYRRLRGCRILALPNYRILFAEQFYDFTEVVRKISEYTELVFTNASRNGRRLVTNTLYGLSRLPGEGTLSDLKAVITPGQDMILVASGPSLDEAIPYIKERKGKNLILAVDSALPPLLRENILPDLMISVDPAKEEDNFVDARVGEIPCVAAFSASKAIYAGRTAPVYYFHNGDYLMERLMPLPTLEAETSVSNYAYALAIYLEAARVIAVGLNLGFAGDRKHAGGALDATLTAKDREKMLAIPANNGEMIYTNVGMNLYRQEFERMLAKHPETELVTTAAQGARIEGARYCTPQAALTSGLEAAECWKGSKPQGILTSEITRLGKATDSILTEVSAFLNKVEDSGIAKVPVLTDEMFTNSFLLYPFLLSCQDRLSFWMDFYEERRLEEENCVLEETRTVMIESCKEVIEQLHAING